jgi:hypothetical protein
MPDEAAADLLLRGLRGQLSPEAAASLSLHQWQGMKVMAATHQVRPLLFSQLKASNAKIPEDVEQDLREAHRDTLASNMRLFHHLSRLLTSLSSAGVPVLVLKGPYLAKELYGHMALRPISDLDLMVRRSDIARALAAVESEGYEQTSKEPVEEQCATAAHVAPLRKPDAPPVELHWNIEGPDSPFKVNPGELWSRAEPLQFLGSQAHILAKEDFLLHLCLHATRHITRDWQDCTVLKSLIDVAQTVRHWQGALDWTTVRDRADRWSARNSVYMMLRLAHDWLDAPVPASVLTTLCPHNFGPEVVHWVRERIFTCPDECDLAIGNNVARLLTTSGLAARVFLAVDRVFPPRAELARLYSVSRRSPLVYLYYPRRWKDLVLERLPSAWRLFQDKTHLFQSARRTSSNLALRTWLQS